MKRLWLATFFGFLSGLFCALGGIKMGFGMWILISTIANRTLIGVAIGISRLKMNWALHGILMGALFGLPLSLSALESGPNGFIILEGASVVYGFVIELLTTVVFKAGIED